MGSTFRSGFLPAARSFRSGVTDKIEESECHANQRMNTGECHTPNQIIEHGKEVVDSAAHQPHSASTRIEQ